MTKLASSSSILYFRVGICQRNIQCDRLTSFALLLLGPFKHLVEFALAGIKGDHKIFIAAKEGYLPISISDSRSRSLSSVLNSRIFAVASPIESCRSLVSMYLLVGDIFLCPCLCQPHQVFELHIMIKFGCLFKGESSCFFKTKKISYPLSDSIRGLEGGDCADAMKSTTSS